MTQSVLDVGVRESSIYRGVLKNFRLYAISDALTDNLLKSINDLISLNITDDLESNELLRLHLKLTNIKYELEKFEFRLSDNMASGLDRVELSIKDVLKENKSYNLNFDDDNFEKFSFSKNYIDFIEHGVIYLFLDIQL